MIQLDWSPLDSIRMDWSPLNGTGIDPIDLDWIDLELIESESSELDWIESEWIGLSGIQPVSEFRPALVRTVPVTVYIVAPELRADSPKYLDAWYLGTI